MICFFPSSLRTEAQEFFAEQRSVSLAAVLVSAILVMNAASAFAMLLALA